MIKPLLLLAACMTLTVPVTYGQVNASGTIASPATDKAAKLPVFDVVSIRQNKSGTSAFRSRSTPDGISVENASLLMLIRQAYAMMNSLDDKFLQVPDWARTDRYDIQAKVDPTDIAELPKLDRTQRGLMLQALLADRFKLVAHREVKEQPVYALVIAKNGPKLTESKPGDTNPNGTEEGNGNKRPDHPIHMSRGSLTAQSISMPNLEILLTQITGRTVLDKTGLKGNLRCHIELRTLRWTTDLPKRSPSGRNPPFNLHGSPGAARPKTGLPESARRGPRHRSRRKAFGKLTTANVTQTT